MKNKGLYTMLCLLIICGSAQAYRVAIFDFDDRLNEPNTIAKYIETRLKAKEDSIQVEQFSGKGDEAFAIKVLVSLDNTGYDLIITITSDALIIAHHTLLKTPTLYTNANNPLFLGFQTLGPQGGNISGASYYVSIEKQLRIYKEIQPGLKKIGFIFDKFNKSRKVELPESRDSCNRLGLNCEIEIVANKMELKSKVKNLIAKEVDAVVATSSGTIYTNIAEFIDVCDQAGIPIYSFNREGVIHGAVAALASDYFLMVDNLLLPMALMVLRDNISPGTMPAAFLDENKLFVNITQIGKFSFNIPKKIKDRLEFIH